MEPANMQPKHGESDRVMPGPFQRFKNLLKALGVQYPIQPASVERVDVDPEHVCGRSAYLRAKCGEPDAKLCGGVCWVDHADSDVYMPGSVRDTHMDRMDDHGRLMREIDEQSNKSNVASQSAEPSESSEPRHVCARHPERTCNCAGGDCGDDDDDWIRTYTNRAVAHYDRIDRQRNSKLVGKPFPVQYVPEHGQFECPVNGKACGSESCCGGICQESWHRAKAGPDWRFTKAADNH